MDPDLTSGSGSCHFRHWPSRSQQKTIFKKKNFCLLLFEGTFTSFFKDKEESRFFLLFLSDDRRIRIRSVPLTNGSGSRRPKKYGSWSTALSFCFHVNFPLFTRSYCEIVAGPETGGKQKYWHVRPTAEVGSQLVRNRRYNFIFRWEVLKNLFYILAEIGRIRYIEFLFAIKFPINIEKRVLNVLYLCIQWYLIWYGFCKFSWRWCVHIRLLLVDRWSPRFFKYRNLDILLSVYIPIIFLRLP